MKDRILMLSFGAVAAIATAGWMRQPQVNIPANTFQAPEAAFSVPVADSISAQTAMPGMHSGVYREVGAPVYTSRPAPRRIEMSHSPRPVTRRAATYRNDDEPALRQRRSDRDYRYSDRDDRPVVKERSKLESAAIIGGSAAAGAAIGGLAGGGKGAAIGAVTGGAGGLIYDRMTHKKRSPDYDDSSYRTRGASYDPYDDDRPRRGDRSTMERIGIIGGGAAAGAAIGGMAGGGKGAAIGALGGGAAGAVYDHMRNRR